MKNAKKLKAMRKKRNPKFKIEVVYRETQDKKDRMRQLWDLLISLPNPEPVEKKSGLNGEKN